MRTNDGCGDARGKEDDAAGTDTMAEGAPATEEDEATTATDVARRRGRHR